VTDAKRSLNCCSCVCCFVCGGEPDRKYCRNSWKFPKRNIASRASAMRQDRRQDVAAGGPKTKRGGTFLKYSIGCMQQPMGQTWNGGAGHHPPTPRWRRPWHEAAQTGGCIVGKLKPSCFQVCMFASCLAIRRFYRLTFKRSYCLQLKRKQKTCRHCCCHAGEVDWSLKWCWRFAFGLSEVTQWTVACTFHTAANNLVTAIVLKRNVQTPFYNVCQSRKISLRSLHY